MLPQFVMSFGQHDDLSADDDIENTKPILISSSTSSSKHTTLSDFANYDQHCKDTSYCETLEENVIGRLTPIEHFNNIENNDMLCRTNPTSNTSEELLSIGRKMDVSIENNLCLINSSSQSKIDITENTYELQESELSKIKTNESFIPGFNLCNVNCSRNILLRASSQPQLNSPIDVNQGLKRSLSSLTLKGKTRPYDHIQSKVKHYIEHLKNYNKLTKLPGEKGNTNNTEELNQSYTKDVSLVCGLQEEIKKLQIHLEERDSLLQEMQANHHSLLLQYGEAKNRLDELRFTSGQKLLVAKSVQTDYPLKENGYIYPDIVDSSNSSRKIVYKCVNQTGQQNFVAENWSITSKENFKIENSSPENVHTSTEVSDSLLNANEEKKSTTLQLNIRNDVTSDEANVKPLPVPSCYGSLGSSGCTSNQLQTLQEREINFSESLPNTSVVKYSNTDEINEETNHESHQSLYKKRIKEKTLKRKMCSRKNEMYFLPINRCKCWAPQNFLECNSDGENSEVSENSSECRMKNVVPPLNLKCCKDSPVPQSNDGIHYLENSDYLNVSLSPQVCESSCKDKINFCKSSVNPGTGSDNYSIYLDTPTSYKSIVINYEVDKRPLLRKGSCHIPACSYHGFKRNGKAKDSFCNCQRYNEKIYETKNDRKMSCCVKGVSSHRTWIQNAHKCCSCNAVADQYKLRYTIIK